jgi:hypothetical protein
MNDGGKIVLYRDDNVSFGGRMVGGIRVRAPRSKVLPQRSGSFKAAAAAMGRHSPVSIDEPSSAGEADDYVPF